MRKETDYRVTNETFYNWSDTEYQLRSVGGEEVGPFDVQQLVSLGIITEEEIREFREAGEEVTITIDFR